MSSGGATVLLTCAGAVVVLLIGAAVYFLGISDISAVAGLPMLSVGAVIVLVILLCLMAVVFASFDLQDKSQALAMPEGSIRAVIALMLIVLFAILSIYLYGSLAVGQLTHLGPLDEAQRTALERSVGGSNLVSVPAAEGRFDVWVRQSASQDGVDFAKQLLVLVGTLVTSIASFYFGSKAATPAAERAANPGGLGSVDAAPPDVDGVSPTAYALGSGAQAFALSGRNLDRITAVRAQFADREVAAADVRRAGGGVGFLLNLPDAAPPGTWRLIVVDSKLGPRMTTQGITVG